MPTEELERLIAGLEDEMHQAAKDLRFEYAARLRDEVHELRRELRQLKEAGRRLGGLGRALQGHAGAVPVERHRSRAASGVLPRIRSAAFSAVIITGA